MIFFLNEAGASKIVYFNVLVGTNNETNVKSVAAKRNSTSSRTVFETSQRNGMHVLREISRNTLGDRNVRVRDAREIDHRRDRIDRAEDTTAFQAPPAAAADGCNGDDDDR